MRLPGVKPGAQAWEACMLPLHYRRSCKSKHQEALINLGSTNHSQVLNKHSPKVHQIRCSIVVSTSACHAEDPGSIPGGGVCFGVLLCCYY